MGMSHNEFEKMMSGDEKALIAKFKEDMMQPTGDALKKFIEEQQKRMPQQLSNEVRVFIERKRVLGVKERAIRRMVKRQFGIVVTP